MSRRLFWQIFLSYLFITVVFLLATVLFATWAVRDFYYRQAEEDLRSRAEMAAVAVARAFDSGPSSVDRLCKTMGMHSGTRLTVILPDGTVLGDSEADPATMDSHRDRPEIKEAFSGDVGTIIRHSRTLGKDMVYVAVPLLEGGETKGVIRASTPLNSVSSTLARVQGKTLIGGAIACLLAALTGFIVSRRITRPLEEIKYGAQRMARGDFSRRLPLYSSDEIGGLALAMNEMADMLDERIDTITSQGNELRAILSSMIEGVIAVDEDEKIISLNEAAANMLGVARIDMKGKSVQEAVRSSALQGLITETLNKQVEVQGEFELAGDVKRTIRGMGSVMRDSEGRLSGAVLVLDDVTETKKYENLRREFVANVSHELRTPITSIKGFVETMLDGALESKEDSVRFLGIISRQVNQMNAIIDDLLLLSGLERDTERGELPLEPGPVREAIEAAVEVCSHRAAQKDISIGVECGGDLQARINQPLLTQALVNLIDNAIAYSSEGGEVTVSCKLQGTNVALEVSDQGIGIDPEHLGRLFERFFRVDKARSRKAGGTGLGLAIVKHIAQYHGGAVGVKSQPQKGSVFSIVLPSGLNSSSRQIG